MGYTYTAPPVSAGGTVTGKLNLSSGLKVTDDDGTTSVDGYRSLLDIRPPDADPEVLGISIKMPGTAWGSGQDYAEGNYLVLLSDADNFGPSGSSPSPILKVISATTNATPVAVTTSTTHGLTTGDIVRISGTGIAALDGAGTVGKWWKVTVTDTTHFTLDTSTAPGSTSAVGYMFTDRSPVLYRLADTGPGQTTAFHLAAGLRGRSGSQPATYGFWIQPAADVVGMIVQNVGTAHWTPTPTQAMFAANDVRGAGGTRTVVQIEADGCLRIRPQEGKAATANLLRTRNDADSADAFTIRNDGSLWATGPSAFGGTAPLAGVHVNAHASADANIPVFVWANSATQTGDLLDIAASNGTVQSRFNKAGYFMTRKSAAPADADLVAGELAIWFDSTNGASKAMFKGKSANSTVVTGSVTLS